MKTIRPSSPTITTLPRRSTAARKMAPPGSLCTMSLSMNTAADSPAWLSAKAASRTKEAVLLRNESIAWNTEKVWTTPPSPPSAGPKISRSRTVLNRITRNKTPQMTAKAAGGPPGTVNAIPAAAAAAQ